VPRYTSVPVLNINEADSGSEKTSSSSGNSIILEEEDEI
jgi:hypothetical protein